MNNLEWYSEVIRFCQLSTSCASCPYHLLGGPVPLPKGSEKPCFMSAETLEELSSWLKERHECSAEEIEGHNDHQWLRELLEIQFAEDDDDDDLFLDEELY